MSTAARLPLPANTSQRCPTRPVLRWELSGPAPGTQRLRLELRRDGNGGLEVVGRSEPAGSHAEIEVCAGWTTEVRALDEDGCFHATGLPGDVRRVKVSLRGGTASPIVLPGLTASEDENA